MAKLKRPLNSEKARGHIDGVIFSESNNVNYARKRTIPRYEYTEKRKQTATDLTAASRLWTAMSDSAREKWEDFANETVKSDVWGQPIKTPAFSWFVSCYLNLRAVKLLKAPDISEPSKPPTPISITTAWQGGVSVRRLAIRVPIPDEYGDYRLRAYWNPIPSPGTFKNKSELIPFDWNSQGTTPEYIQLIKNYNSTTALEVVGQHTVIVKLIDANSGLASSELKGIITIPEP